MTWWRTENTRRKTYPGAVGVYMPDALSIFTAGGTDYLVTANEGDAREWGDYCNEIKKTLTAEDGTEAEKVRVLDKSLVTVPDESGGISLRRPLLRHL